MLTAACNASQGKIDSNDPNYFNGKTITLLVTGKPGGGIDLNARITAKYLTKHLPGHPTFTFTTMTGGAGIQNANTLTAAKADGLTIGATGPGIATFQVAGEPGVAYDATKFQYIGGPGDVDGVIYVKNSTGVSTVDGMKTVKTPIKLGAGPRTNSAYVVPELLRTDAGWNISVVAGLGATSDVFLAVDRGDVQGGWESYQALQSGRKEWIDNGTIKFIARLGTTEKALDGLPQVFDLLPKDDAALVTLLYPGWGDPLVAPPGTPANVMKLYHDAMAAMAADPEFIAEAQKAGVSTKVVTGDEDLQIAKKVLATPPAALDRYKKLIAD